MDLPLNLLLQEALIPANPTALAADDEVCAALPVRAVRRGPAANGARLMRICLLAGLLGMAHGGRAQDINATVGPNSGTSANFVDIQNSSGDKWYFWGAPTPAAASMSRMDGIEVGEYPWPSPGSFAPDPTNLVQNRLFANEFLRVYPKTVAVSNVIQVEFSYSPLGTHYHINVAVTPGAQVTSLDIIDPSPSAATIVHWRVSFDRAISGVTAANFTFANVAGLTNVSITGISADAAQPSTNWTITVNSGTGNGLLGLKWAGHSSESPSVPNPFVGQLYDFSSYPIITLDPVGPKNGRAIDRNTTWTMTAAAVVRGAPVNYQWYSGSSKNPNAATAISGATNSSYTPPAFADLGTNQYFCHAYTTPGYYGNSLTATIIVVDPPKIVTQPSNTPVAINQPATLAVDATGTSLQYQWFQGNPPDMSAPVGSNSPVLVTAPLTASTNYWVQITNIGPTIANSVAATAIVIASLTAAPGNYSSSVGAAYPSAFAVTARDYLNNLATNVPVTFTAPTGAVPSGTFPGPSLSTTNSTTEGGRAIAPTCTANGVCGIYNLSANFSTLSASFSCTNLPTFNAATLAGLTNAYTTPAYSLATRTGAQSPGGTFSGAGVSGGNFDPATAGFGPHVITYAVNGVQASFTINVVEAPSLVVTTNADVANPFDEFTSLREALAYSTTLSGPQTITFAPGLAGQTVTLASGWNGPDDTSALRVLNQVSIVGPVTAPGITVAMAPGVLRRHLLVEDSGDLTLAQLTFTNGYSADYGGSVESFGALTISNCTFAGNYAHDLGGAIHSEIGSASLVIENSTITGNTASNFAGVIGSGASQTYFQNVTITGNKCPYALSLYANTATMVNSILAGNNNDGVLPYGTSAFSTQSVNNLIGTGGTAGLVNGVNNNHVGLSAASLHLGALANNGGPTPTIAVLPGSPAINGGIVISGRTTDQRGRPISAAPDIGAFEYQAPMITSPTNVTFLAGLSNSFTLTATGELPPTLSVAGTLPPGVNFTSPAALSGIPPFGSAGIYPLTVLASYGVSAVVTQYLRLTIVDLAARPSFNTNGLGWALNGDTVNGGPQITNNVFTLTDGTSGENRSAWFRYPLYVGAFEASFTYQDVGLYGADGVGFVIQNDPRGPTALGLAGGGLAYAGITSSVALLLNIYPGAPGGPSGLMLGTNGVGAFDASGAPSGNSYQSTAPVDLDMRNPVAVALRYTGGILQVSLTDTVSSVNFQTNIAVDVAAFTGTNVAWVGITGSEGVVLSHQIVSNFRYVPLPVLLSNPDGSGSLNLSWPASIYGYHLQSSSNLLGNVWADLPATVTQTIGFNLATVATTNNSEFFRLVLPPQ